MMHNSSHNLKPYYQAIWTNRVFGFLDAKDGRPGMALNIYGHNY